MTIDVCIFNRKLCLWIQIQELVYTGTYTHTITNLLFDSNYSGLGNNMLLTL